MNPNLDLYENHCSLLEGDWGEVADAQHQHTEAMYLVITLRLLYNLKKEIGNVSAVAGKDLGHKPSYDALVTLETAKG